MDLADLTDHSLFLDDGLRLHPLWLLNVVQAVVLHNGVSLALSLVDYLRSTLLSTISTIQQFLFLLKLLSPILPKLSTDSGRLTALTLDLFTALRRVSVTTPPSDTQSILICDVLFFVFDNYPVDVTKEKTMELVQSLPAQFHNRLRILTQSQSCEKAVLR